METIDRDREADPRREDPSRACSRGPTSTREPSSCSRRRTVELAREVARQSVVVLENDGILPLDPGRGQRIALIGPTADDPLALLCGYSFPVHLILNDAGESAAQVVTPRAAFEKAFGAERVTYAQGLRHHRGAQVRLPGVPGRRREEHVARAGLAGLEADGPHPRGHGVRAGGGHRGGVRRGPGGPVPDRHRGRGLRRRLARPPGRPAAAARGGGRDRQAGRGGADERPPVQPGRARGQGRRVRHGLRRRPGGRHRAGRRADREGRALGPAQPSRCRRTSAPCPTTTTTR